MANPTRQVISATGSGTAQQMDFLACPFQASVGIDLSGATGASVTLQFTLSDINGEIVTNGGVAAPSFTPLWRNDPNATSVTNSTVSYYTSGPVVAIRPVINALTSGVVVIEYVQGINSNAS
jgi:hypothetical protein